MFQKYRICPEDQLLDLHTGRERQDGEVGREEGEKGEEGEEGERLGRERQDGKVEEREKQDGEVRREGKEREVGRRAIGGKIEDKRFDIILKMIHPHTLTPSHQSTNGHVVPYLC